MSTDCSSVDACPKVSALSNMQQEVDENNHEVCWVCLAGEGEEDGKLEFPCKCPRSVHLKCLARWQLQSAGKHEEDRCRFCNDRLPDWKTSMTPGGVKPVCPVMAIKFEGKTYKLRVKPGPEGLREFQNQVKQLLGFDINEDFDVTFECQIPETGEKMKLNGLSSYGAATHCAAITAGAREVSPKTKSHSFSGTQALDMSKAADGAVQRCNSTASCPDAGALSRFCSHARRSSPLGTPVISQSIAAPSPFTGGRSEGDCKTSSSMRSFVRPFLGLFAKLRKQSTSRSNLQ